MSALDVCLEYVCLTCLPSGSALYVCLVNADISGWETWAVTTMQYMFDGASASAPLADLTDLARTPHGPPTGPFLNLTAGVVCMAWGLTLRLTCGGLAGGCRRFGGGSVGA